MTLQLRRPGSPRPGRRATALAAVALLGSAGLLAGCSGDDDSSDTKAQSAPPPAAAVPVPIKAGVDRTVKIGLLLSLSSPPGQGEGLSVRSAGAQVAAYRLGQGGTTVTLDPADDQGTKAGARKAVAQLVDDGVSGIVALSEGSHLQAAYQAASQAGVAIIAPYDRSEGELPQGVWTTGPTTAEVDQALVEGMKSQGLSSPYVVSGDGVAAPRVGSTDAAPLTSQGLDALAQRIVKAAKAGNVDSAVVAAAPDTQGQLVAALQGLDPDLPIVLTPEALTPLFVESIVKADGSPAGGQWFTAGVDDGDTATTGSGAAADRVAAFFTALRQEAGDPKATDVFDSQPFSEVADGADVASHDAVVALVQGVAKAGSTDPSKVEAALSGLTLDGSDGLAGPDLDLSQTDALPRESVVPLTATTQDPGVRPTSTDPRLFWFPVPTKG